MCTDGIQRILMAMTRSHVRRLLVVSAYGAAESHHRDLYNLLLWTLLKEKMMDKERMEELRAIGLARATVEAEREIPGFPPGCPATTPCQFLRSTTIVGGTDPDGSGDVPRVITVSVRSLIRQAGPIAVTAVYIKH